MKGVSSSESENLLIFYVTIDVIFKHPLDFIDEKNLKKKRTVVGFIQEIGCTAESEECMRKVVLALVLREHERNTTTAVFSRIGIIAKSKLKEEIYDDGDVSVALLGDPLKSGVWYKTGRGYYYEK